MLVIVHTDGGQVLLLNRQTPFEFWQSVTGSLYPGESPAAAARRELAEETGLGANGQFIDAGRCRTFTIDPRWRHRYPAGVTENREHEWHYRMRVPQDVEINVKEHSAWRWVTLDEAIAAVWSWTNREALEALQLELR